MLVSLAISRFLWVDFSDPNWLLIVVFSGVVSVYWEFCRPGLVVPGVAGAAMVVVGIFELLQFAPDWRGVGLIALSVVLFTLNGFLNVAGAGALYLGLTLLVPGRVRPLTAIAIALPFAALTSYLFGVAARARLNKTVRRYAGKTT